MAPAPEQTASTSRDSRSGSPKAVSSTARALSLTVSLQTSRAKASVRSGVGNCISRSLQASCVAMRAASPDQLFCRPSTCAASDGVRPPSCSRPLRLSDAMVRCAAREGARRRSGCGRSLTFASNSRSRSLSSLCARPAREPKGNNTKRPCKDEPPSMSARSASNSASSSGWRSPSSATGAMRCGPMPMRPPPSSATSLSPPRPMVRTSMARTMVRQPPSSAPFSLTFGRPSISTPRSVVVPPISDRMKLSSPDSHCAPTRLAAGPDRTVSIGRVATLSASASVPSPLTIISGQSMCSCAIARFTASISVETREIRRALSAAVSARRGASSALDNSQDRVTGLPVRATISARAACSCAALRTAKVDATANASTLGAMRCSADSSAT